MNTPKNFQISVDTSKIWQYMEKERLSIKKMAMLCNLSTTTLTTILTTGQTKKYIQLFKLANVMQTSIRDLVIE